MTTAEKARIRLEKQHDWTLEIVYGLTTRDCKNIVRKKGRVSLDRHNMRETIGPICRRCRNLFEQDPPEECPGTPSTPSLSVVKP